MRETFLHSDWTFCNVTPKVPYERTAVQDQPWLPAVVPGHVHLDLEANGIIESPFYRMGELGCRWVDEQDWSYKTTFSWTAAPELPRRVLKFEGLDTVCIVKLNGSVLGEYDNMFIPIEIDVSEALREGDNELEVNFMSAVRVGGERRSAYFAAEGLAEDCKQFDERAFVRKAQYMSAWDWGPRLVSCGIWRPVSLIEFAARITQFSVRQEPLPDGSFRVWTETKAEGRGEVTLSFGETELSSPADRIQELDLVIADPELWWPNGMGEPFLYEAAGSISGGDTIYRQVGLRTITLDRTRDEIGERFTFLINGKKLWARGANWIPNDSFPSRISAEDYASQIFLCRDLGMNMLRVWGGGLYELDAFYDACDEAGILVWQDFPFACSYYPDGEAACAAARTEAEVNVLRLRDRASLALWCGNNENLTMWQGKWGGAKSPHRYYGENLYDQVLPQLLSQLDPGRSYIPTSPIGQEEGGDCNQGRFGDSHYWDVWHGRGDWIHYRDSDTRFSSEFGFASSCSVAQWQEVLGQDDGDPAGPVVRWHDKTGKGLDKFTSYVELHYPPSESIEKWTYYSQLNQRDALRFGIEHWRRSSFCQGTLIWQFNDCWPVQSWAVQDYMRLLKPAAYELQRLYSARLISLVHEEGQVSAILVNDGELTWDASLEFAAHSVTDGEVLFQQTLDATVQPGERVRVCSIDLASLGPVLVRVVSASGERAEMLTAEPKDILFGEADIDVELTEDALIVHVEGIVVDFVLINPDAPHEIRLKGWPASGAPALTLINESVVFELDDLPESLHATWLHGEGVWSFGGDDEDDLFEDVEIE